MRCKYLSRDVVFKILLKNWLKLKKCFCRIALVLTFFWRTRVDFLLPVNFFARFFFSLARRSEIFQGVCFDLNTRILLMWFIARIARARRDPGPLRYFQGRARRNGRHISYSALLCSSHSQAPPSIFMPFAFSPSSALSAPPTPRLPPAAGQQQPYPLSAAASF